MDLPQIFAFYSFKGGVGRTMALVNLAYALVAKGRNVLILDLDLEAPGLSGFLRRHHEITEFPRHDMVDLLLWAKQTAQYVSEDAPLDRNALPPLSDYAVRVPPEKLVSIPNRSWDVGRLDVIPIDESRNFYERLSELGTGSMNRDTLLQVGSLLQSWLKTRRVALEVPDYYDSVPDEDRSAPYDYVFIDSRTGITEVGGLCIGPLSDQLIVLCGLNDQNINGTRQFLEEVGVMRTSFDHQPALSKPTMFVASPVPNSDLAAKDQRLEQLRLQLKPIAAQLSYHPQMALMETIFVRDFPNEFLSSEYQNLLDQLLTNAGDRADFDPSIFQLFAVTATDLIDDQTRTKIRELVRLAPVSNSNGPLSAILEKYRNNVTDDCDFQLLDRVCRALASSSGAEQFVALGRWSELLFRWSQHTSDSTLATRRFGEADEHTRDLCSRHRIGEPQSPVTTAKHPPRRGCETWDA